MICHTHNQPRGTNCDFDIQVQMVRNAANEFKAWHLTMYWSWGLILQQWNLDLSIKATSFCYSHVYLVWAYGHHNDVYHKSMQDMSPGNKFGEK